MRFALITLLWLDRNIEKCIIITSYSLLSCIVFVEIIRRFFFGIQAPWSTQVPIYLYIILAWIGAAYNARQRSHLSFTEYRKRLSYSKRYLCELADFAGWVILSLFVIYYSVEQAMVIKDNFGMIFGTEIFVWYFYLATPVGWALLLVRVVQNLVEDTRVFLQAKNAAREA